MENLTFRWLKLEDCATLKIFIDKLNDAEGLGNITKLTVTDLIKDGFSNPPRFQCIIVEENGNIKAYCMFCSIYDSDVGKKIYIEDIYVVDELRKAGIGSAMLQIVAQDF